MYIMLYNTVEENDEMSSTDTEIYLTGFLYFLWLAQIGLKCSWNTELKIKLQKYWFVFITYMMLDMLVAILCNFNIESDNKCLFFFMHFCYFFLSYLLLLMADNHFCVLLIVPYSFSSAWFAFIYFHPLCLICPFWLPSSFITFVFNVCFSFVSLAVLCNFFPMWRCEWFLGIFLFYFFFFFFTSFGILVRMMTFHWCRSQCWVEKRWKRERERRDRANLPTAINLNITINSCVSF